MVVVGAVCGGVGGGGDGGGTCLLNVCIFLPESAVSLFVRQAMRTSDLQMGLSQFA